MAWQLTRTTDTQSRRPAVRTHLVAALTSGLVTCLISAPMSAQAQQCSQQLPDPRASFTEQTEAPKFRLIQGACPALLAPVAPLASDVRRPAATGPQSVTIDMSESKAYSAPTVATTWPHRARTQAGESAYRSQSRRKREIRVLSLSAPMIDVAREHDLDPLLLHAIAHVESRHNPNAVSHAGAQGLMQVMPATGKRFGAPTKKGALLNINTNLSASASYLRLLSLRFQGDLKLMLAAYNAGEGAVDKAGGNIPPYPETQAYVRDVLRVYGRLAERFIVTDTGRLQQRVESRHLQP